MKKQHIGLAAFLGALIFCYTFFLQPNISGTPLTEAPAKKPQTILLIPLDSRPPCRQFVVDAALIDNIKIILPPTELLDYYYQEGDTKKLSKWLKDNFHNVDAAVISVDQLLHGGLIASREFKSNDLAVKNLPTFFEELHKKEPNIPIYAFSILPRITPPPSIGGYSLWKDFIEFSRLTDQLSTVYDADKAARLSQLKAELPAKDLAEYIARYESNHKLNKELASLVKKGVLKQLVIGQDDGEEFGIPNIKKRELKKYLASEKISEKDVFITHGADEVALSLLAKISADKHHYTPKVYVEYNTDNIRSKLMPFMAGSVEETVKEKLAFINAKEVASPEQADFTFFVSCVDSSTIDTRKDSADRIKKLMLSGSSIALTDLSENFVSEETVFPFLLKNSTPLHRLIAYAGWNTTSNSIGTAFSQAVLFSAAKKDAKSTEDAKNICRHNIAFLDNRFLEDYYFLKEIADTVNISLQKAGYIYVNDLDLEHNYQWANAMLQKSLRERLENLKYTKAFRAPLEVTAPDGTVKLMVKDLAIDTCYPWPRTFEIYLRTTPTIIELP